MSTGTKVFGAALLALTSAISTTTAAGEPAVSGAVGVTGQGEMTWRAGVSQDWDKRWWEGNKGYLSGYWDAAYTYWEGGDEASAAHSLSFSPVLVYQFHGQRFRPFVEFGIGGVPVLENRCRRARYGLGVPFRGSSRRRSGAARWQPPRRACHPLFKRRPETAERGHRKLRPVLHSQLLNHRKSAGLIGIVDRYHPNIAIFQSNWLAYNCQTVNRHR